VISIHDGELKIFSGILFGSIVVFAGILNIFSDNNNQNNCMEKKNRAIAHDLSIIPGLGHMYLGKIKMGCLMFGLFTFSILLLILSSYFDQPHSQIYFVYSVSLLTFSIFWSLIRICGVCDEMNLTFEVNFLRNYYVSNVQKCEKILIFSTYAWLIIVMLLFILFSDMDLQTIWVGFMFPTIFPIYYWIERRRKNALS
jgi:hypothetical protein